MHAIHSIIAALACCGPGELPKSDDPSIEIELFAENPQLTTPTGIAVDHKGRVFVAESNTHFRPEGYDGPAKDRILILEDTDNDGKADKRTVFHEGFTHLMDLEFHPDGSLYVATRMDIHRMRDKNGDGKADDVVPIVIMKTTGTYPHNGISGLCFNHDKSLNFGLGENLGRDYTLVGTDKVNIKGGGEGGSTYHVQADGSKLRRVTTGWWNPFGMCVDSHGRIFGTDNDPGASPPCRLIQIHEGADYGYEYRYGRTGLHPLISWTGDLPGNIPMIGGTGEAPCGIISVERSNLPAKYRGNLLVAAWADHQIERYVVSQPVDSGQVTVERRTLVLGGNDFRPVGLTTGPDGSLYVSDWVSASYQLHGLGRIWKISGKQSTGKRANATDNARNIFELSAEKLGGIVRADKDTAARVQAVQELARRGAPVAQWATKQYPLAVRAVAVTQLKLPGDAQAIIEAADSSDPVLRHSAIQSLASQTRSAEFGSMPLAVQLLAMKRSPHRSEFATSGIMEKTIDGTATEAWEIAVKWIADDKLEKLRGKLTQQLNEKPLSVNQYLMLVAAIDRLDGKKPSDIPKQNQLARTALDAKNSVSLRVATLRLSRANNPALTTPVVVALLKNEEPAIRLEAIRLLTGRTDDDSISALLKLANQNSTPLNERVQGIAALAPVQQSVLKQLLALSRDRTKIVSLSALQSLVGSKLTEPQSLELLDRAISKFIAKDAALTEAAQRVVGVKLKRPKETDTDAWLKLLDGKGDAESGERLFFHTKVGSCSKCHQHSGRGTAVGPSLSLIARRLPKDQNQAKRWLLETILQPSKDMAPQYTPWTVVTKDGKQLTGLPRRKGGNSEAYLGIDGKEFSVKKKDIDFHQESRTSIMPKGLLQNLTRQELRDLFEFLLQSE
jgi:putative membrane-bound dehydrogenase-like protein